MVLMLLLLVDGKGLLYLPAVSSNSSLIAVLSLFCGAHERNSAVFWDRQRTSTVLPHPKPLQSLLSHHLWSATIHQRDLKDNDARTYAIYEATMPHLEEASNALIPHIAFDEAIMPSSC